MSGDAAVQTARDYYNSSDADQFYSAIWGGEDIHIGIYLSDREPIELASRRTVEKMASLLAAARPAPRVLDMGSGYCGAARYLVKEHNATVTAVNLSEVENERARQLNRQAGLAARIDVHDGSFEELSFADATFDVVWSQDAILHSERRRQVLAEAHRVLKPGGTFVFTDPMQSDDCPDGVLDPILSRIHLSSLGSPRFYQSAAELAGFEVVGFEDLTGQLVNHYRRVLEETVAQKGALKDRVSAAYVDNMTRGLGRWIEGGQAGHLAWGIFQLRKKL